MTQKLTHPSLTHLDANGDIAMVDVADKTITKRTAAATGKVIFRPTFTKPLKPQTDRHVKAQSPRPPTLQGSWPPNVPTS